MRFINRSHREMLGSVFNQDQDDLGGVAGYRASGNILDQYPLLPEVLGMSEPEETRYQLGDCTVHHGYCAHVSNATVFHNGLDFSLSFWQIPISLGLAGEHQQRN